ncbi:unnamed protein product [Rhizophagus irregularis]|nr:unnamed protein product [Rhizophagus irregularis]
MLDVTTCYIATEPEKQLIIVAYRGTEPGSIKNYISDFVIYHDTWKPAPGTLVHHGFLNAWEQIQPQVTDDLLKLIQEKPDFRIGFMGHSLGGALATFSALDLINKAPELAKNEKLFLSTFGQPRMGDEKFAEFVDENLRAIRTVVHGDPIPRLPPPWPIPFIGSYKHFGKELYINNPDAFQECVAEDPNCSESVPFGQLDLKYHSGPYYGVNMRDATRELNGVNGTKGINATKEVNSTKEVNGAKEVNGTKGVNGTKEVKGTKGVNGVDRAKGYR